jgi:hypothetical protein
MDSRRGLMEYERIRTDADPVAGSEPDIGLGAPVIQKRPVGGVQIEQPVIARFIGANDGVPPGNSPLEQPAVVFRSPAHPQQPHNLNCLRFPRGQPRIGTIGSRPGCGDGTSIGHCGQGRSMAVTNDDLGKRVRGTAER